MRSKAENIARVVVYDPVTQNMRATRYGLYEAGFREIECFSELSEARLRIEELPLDLLVLDADETGAVFDLIREVRRGDLGENPFSVVFLTSWRRSPELVETALQSGADDIIVRPFSTSFITRRVQSAAQNRKKFVVTGDYLGPDRRNDSTREADPSIRLFDPPNTLQIAVTGDAGALEANAAEIEACKAQVRRERAVRLAVRLGVEAELALAGERPLADVYAISQELSAAIDPEAAEATKLAAAIERRLASDDEVRKNLKLVHELALGVCMICGGEDGDDSGRYVSEISDLVGRLRAKPSEAA